MVVPGTTSGPMVEVHLDRPRQRLHGVGAALTESSASLIAGLPERERRALLEHLFDPRRGALSVLRIVIGASDFSLEHRSLADSETPDPDLNAFSIERDELWVIPVLREILAIHPNLEIIASPWSAPAWMKAPRSYMFGVLRREYEPAYARYLVRFVESYRSAGIPVRWLTVQNEPAAIQLDYPSMVMTAAQQARLVRDHLGPRLSEAQLPTRVLAWDHNWCDEKPGIGCRDSGPALFPLDVLAEVEGAAPFAGTAFHCYRGDQATAYETMHAVWPGLQIWQTECSGGEWQNDPLADTARLVLTGWNHWANASMLWNLALDPTNGPHLGGCGTCRGVVTVDPESGTWIPEVDRDVLATIARYGPKHSLVLETDVTQDAGILAAGVCSPSRRPAAIVLNAADATTATIRFGDLDLPIELRARSLTAVRAPAGTRCGPTPKPAGTTH